MLKDIIDQVTKVLADTGSARLELTKQEQIELFQTISEYLTLEELSTAIDVFQSERYFMKK